MEDSEDKKAIIIQKVWRGYRERKKNKGVFKKRSEERRVGKEC
jgi:hypothetical protein